MALVSIGTLSPTKVPGLGDSADIQEALRVYHYGGTGYTAETTATNLPAASIARYLYELQADIDAVDTTTLIAKSFFDVKGDLISASANNTDSSNYWSPCCIICGGRAALYEDLKVKW